MKKLKKIAEFWREFLVGIVAAIIGAILLVAAVTFLPSVSISFTLAVLIVFGALGGVGFVCLLILGVRFYQG